MKCPKPGQKDKRSQNDPLYLTLPIDEATETQNREAGARPRARVLVWASPQCPAGTGTGGQEQGSW